MQDALLCYYGMIVNVLFLQWKGEIQEFCPNTKMLLVGCKSDLRTDVSTLVELSNHRQTPVSYDQVSPDDSIFCLLLSDFSNDAFHHCICNRV